MKPETEMTNEELDAEIRSYGLDPEEVAINAFSKLCVVLQQKSAELAAAKSRIGDLEQERDRLKETQVTCAMEDELMEAEFLRSQFDALGIAKETTRKGSITETVTWNKRADDLHAQLQAVTQQRERLISVLKKARKHRGVYLHDAECFSINGTKPCVCGRESLVGEIDEALDAAGVRPIDMPHHEPETEGFGYDRTVVE